jgi:hypothetical protein
MAAPTQPSPFIWANGTNAIKLDPGSTKRATGWAYDSTTGFGEYPKMEWVNNELYNTSQWINYNQAVGSYFSTLNTNGSFGYSVLRLNNLTDTVVTIGSRGQPTRLNLSNISINTSGKPVYANGLFTAPINGIFSFDVTLNLKLVGQNTNYDTTGRSTYLNLYFQSDVISKGLTKSSYGNRLTNFGDYNRNQVSTNRTVYTSVNYRIYKKMSQGDTAYVLNSLSSLNMDSSPAPNTYVVTLLKSSRVIVTWDTYQYFYNG